MKDARSAIDETEQLNVDIPRALGDRLRKYKAAQKGRTTKTIVEAALTTWLAEQERREKKRGA